MFEYLRLPPSPCKDCTERHMKCHGECSKYIEFRRICDEKRSERMKNVESIDMLKAQKSRLQAVTRRNLYRKKQGGSE